MLPALKQIAAQSVPKQVKAAPKRATTFFLGLSVAIKIRGSRKRGSGSSRARCGVHHECFPREGKEHTMISSSPPSSTGQYQVIAACDLSPLGDRAVEDALLLCATRQHSMLHVITVVSTHARGVVLPGDARVLAYEEAQEIVRIHLAGIVDRCLADGVHVSLELSASHVIVGEPAACICQLADEIDADLVVLGTHDRRGIGRMLHNSLTAEVMRRAQCAVLVIRPRDFLEGKKLPDVQPPLGPDEHHLLALRSAPTYHYVPRASRPPARIMPAL
jgi:nucleotide-binding universal stress UspA family protein